MASLDTRTLLFVVFLGMALLFMFFASELSISPVIKLILLLLGLFFDVIAFSVRFYSYIMVPIMKNKKGIVELSTDEPFIFAPSNNAILVRDGNSVFASAFIKIPIYKSATEMLDQEKENFAKLFGNLVTLSKNPIRLTSQLYMINKDDYVNRIRDRLNASEELYRKLEENKDSKRTELERVRGELTMWHNMYDNIIRTQSYSLISYAIVSAEGGTNEEAANLVLQYADEVVAGVGAIFGVKPSIASGGEILLMMEPDYTIPLSVITEQIKQKTLSEGAV